MRPDGARPRSTYRLQLGPDLRFSDVTAIAGYLGSLGVTHVYLSPILTAVPGSTHGYDVVDHRRIDPELGGARGFAAMSRALLAHGVGLVVDVVPNHMAVPVPESLNGPLWSVLREGKASAYSSWFDIDWTTHGGRVLLPILDGPLADNLQTLHVETSDTEPVLAYFDHRLPIAAGTAGLPIDELVEAQHHLLADWRSAATELNYRRFCDITSLIGLRVEDPAVFHASHGLLAKLVLDDRVQGLRIDHPDGLADPAGYLEALAAATDGAWVVVEKIVADGEPLPPDWKAAGTTGYDTLSVLNALLVDPQGEAALTETYGELTGANVDFAAVAADGKRLIATEVLAAEVARAARAHADADFDRQRLGAAIVEVLIDLEVYRPYLSSPTTMRAFDHACETATTRRPDLAGEITGVRTGMRQGGEFATRFAQLAAAVYAKGVEDTAFYRYARLLALNEVGGDPARFGTDLAAFHRYAATMQRETPTAMTALSTHDTKRSEDVRARLAVLSELPQEWRAAAEQWLQRADTLGCPDAHTAYVFWQTLVGAWPLTVERAARYMEKATREAKLATSWQSPDAGYDNAVRNFVAAVFADEPLLADVEAFVETIRPYGRANSLAQKLLQLTMPGVPDVYQGCELATFTLVDPDNRGAVDFGARRDALADLLDPKLRLTATALRLRRDHPEWFAAYTPLLAAGPAAEHVVAFARSPQLIAVATRLSGRLARDGGWRATSLVLPDGTWVDALTGREHDGGELPMADLLVDGPVALLVPGVTLTP